VIPTDGRKHPDDIDSSFLGDSVAHWEGDTLVVDVTGFNDKTWLAGVAGRTTKTFCATRNYSRASGFTTASLQSHDREGVEAGARERQGFRFRSLIHKYRRQVIGLKVGQLLRANGGLMD